MPQLVPPASVVKDTPLQAGTSYGYIYKTTNLINGMMYIGQRIGVFRKSYLGSGSWLKNAIKKYGAENFLVKQIMIGESFSHLNGQEIKAIARYRKVYGRDRLYNLDDGGRLGGRTGGHHDESTKNKIRAKHLGMRPSAESRLKNSLAQKGKTSWMKGRSTPEEVRNKISASCKGKVPWNKGVPKTEEAIESNRQAQNDFYIRNLWAVSLLNGK